MIFPTHTCFDDALDLIEAMVIADRREMDKLQLVHAICLMPDGQPYAHAWVERFDQCLFIGIVNGDRCRMKSPKAEFYAQHKIQKSTRYTVRQAYQENTRTNHYGPWQPEYEALCGHREREKFLLTEQDGTPGIYCKQCGRISFHPKDIEARYCAACNQFLVEA